MTIQKGGIGFKTECVLHLSTGITLQAEGEAGDAYSSADEAASNIEKTPKPL